MFLRDRPKSKQFEEIRALGEEAFSFKFEASTFMSSFSDHLPLISISMYSLILAGCVQVQFWEIVFQRGTQKYLEVPWVLGTEQYSIYIIYIYSIYLWFWGFPKNILLICFYNLSGFIEDILTNITKDK